MAVVARLGVDTYRQHFADLWSDVARERWLADQFAPHRIAEEIEGDRYRYDLCYVGDDAVGFSKCLHDSAPPTRDARGFELQKLYFLDTHVGRGYGSALVDYLCDIGRDANEPFAWLKVLKSNRAAERLYRRLGFESIGEIPCATDLREIGMHVLARPLVQSRSIR